jgi:nucleotide-binding universal stress UspA family protein
MGCRGEDRTVVVGVDGSPQSLRAVRWGAVEAARRNAVLRLVSAFDWLPARNSGHPRLIHRAGCAVAVVGSSPEGGGPDVV